MKLLQKVKVKYNGFSLVELLMAISIFTIVISTVAIFSLDTLNYSANDRKKIKATIYIQEISNAILLNKSDLWQSIVEQTGEGEKSIQFVNNKYQIVDGTDIEDEITLSFTVETTERDLSGNIVSSGGIEDPFSRRVVINAEWEDVLGNLKTISYDLYLNNWNVREWIDTTESDFILGSTLNSTVRSEPVDDGEVELAELFYPDWCNPVLSLYEYDIPGNGNATSVFATDDGAYIGTGGNASGISVTQLSISSDEPPIVIVEEEYDNDFINRIYVLGNYAYLATSDNKKEVMILDVSVEPYVEIGHYNTSGNDNASAIWIDDRGVGYVAYGNKVDIFDVGYVSGNVGTLSANSGARSSLATLSVVGNSSLVTKIDIKSNYIFAALDDSQYELAIISVNNPSSPTILSRTSINGQAVYDLYVSEDTNRVYIGTENSESANEFFILNTSNKSVSAPIVGSYNSNGTSIHGISVIPDDNIAILVGVGGTEYQAVELANESSPQYCGGLNVNTGIYDIDSLYDNNGNKFSYLMTKDNTGEFKIVRGGPGGGGSNGFGYITEGTFTSQIFDSQSLNTNFLNVDWDSDLPDNTEIQIQVRFSNSADMDGAEWYGSGGVNSYFTAPEMLSILNGEQLNKRYFQYKATLSTSNTLVTPAFNNFNLFYEAL